MKPSWPWLRLSVVFLLVALLAFAAASSAGLLIKRQALDPAQIEWGGGNAYVCNLKLPPLVQLGLLTVASDDVAGDYQKSLASTLALYEDGRPLGMPHSLESTIRQKGGGAFSHGQFGRGLLFSTSDNSNPRRNGRHYVVRYPMVWAWPLKPLINGTLILSIVLTAPELAGLIQGLIVRILGVLLPSWLPLRPSRRHALSFLFCFVSTASITVGLLDFNRPAQPAKYPQIPNPADLYVAAYEAQNPDHLIFTHGLFGLKKRIGEADILLTGNSHMEFGISAGQLSTLLQSALGHPVKVINLGRGAGTAEETKMILDLNGARDKIIIVDASDPGNSPSSYDLFFKFNSTHAAWHVLNDSANFLKDHLLGGLIPMVTYTNGELEITDPLQTYVLRDWNGQDVYSYWIKGERFRVAHPLPAAIPVSQRVRFGATVVETMGPDWCAGRNLHCLYTLIPFPGADLAGTAAWAREKQLPYLDLADQGLTYVEGRSPLYGHLDLAGREKLTSRLAAQLSPLLRTTPDTSGP